MKLSHIALATSALLALNGCLKVKDNNNSEMVAQAIDKQTTAQQQLAAEQQKKQQLTLNGLVRGYQDSVDLTNAQVRLLIGNTLTEPVKVVDGKYSFSNVPKGSDIAVIVENKEKNVNFVTEVATLTTTSAVTENAVQQVPLITVAKPVSYKFQVLDQKTNLPLELPKVYANTNAAISSLLLDAYVLKASFDKASGDYSITLPGNFQNMILAELDLDKDGLQDYESEAGTNVLFTRSTLSDGYIYLEPVVQSYQEVAFKMVFADSVSSTFLNVPFMLVNNFKQPVQRIASTANDSFNGKVRFYGSTVNVQIPQFDTETKRYESTWLTITKLDNERFNINSTQYKIANGILNLSAVLSGNDKSVASSLRVVNAPQQVVNNSLNYLFNLPVGLEANSFTLQSLGEITVTPGSDLPGAPAKGTTRIAPAASASVPFTMLHNDTVASLNLTALIKPGQQQRLHLNEAGILGNARNKLSGALETLTSDTMLIGSAVRTEFKPEDIRIDNMNYFSGGNLVVPTTTAGVMNSAWLNNYVWRFAVLLPESALSLSQLEYKLSYNNRQLTRNVVSPSAHQYKVAVPLAENEQIDIQGNVWDGYLGTESKGMATAGRFTQEIVYFHDNLPDHTAAVPVLMTLDYSYLTKAGVKVSGTVQLPVL
jgi:hypothetical protein